MVTTSNSKLLQQDLTFRDRRGPSNAIEKRRNVTTASVTFSASLDLYVPYYLTLNNAGGNVGGYTLNGTNPDTTSPTGSAVPLPISDGQDVQILVVSGNQTLKVIMEPTTSGGQTKGDFTLFTVTDLSTADGTD